MFSFFHSSQSFCPVFPLGSIRPVTLVLLYIVLENDKICLSILCTFPIVCQAKLRHQRATKNIIIVLPQHDKKLLEKQEAKNEKFSCIITIRRNIFISVIIQKQLSFCVFSLEGFLVEYLILFNRLVALVDI